MKLLVNGCSFSANYYLANNLARQLGFDGAESIAIGGSSNRRIIRSTIEYLESNQGIGFVLLGLSFFRRREGAFLPADQDWVQYSANGMQGHCAPHDAVFKNDMPRAEIEQYIQDIYKYDVDIKYMEQLLCDLIMLSGYLKSRNINHLIFNFCERRYTDYFAVHSDSVLVKAVQSNKQIVPLNEFNANLFLRDHNAKYAEPEERWEPFARHYDGEEYIHLNNYFMNHLRTNSLI